MKVFQDTTGLGMREGISRTADFIIFLTPLGINVVICPSALETTLTGL